MAAFVAEGKEARPTWITRAVRTSASPTPGGERQGGVLGVYSRPIVPRPVNTRGSHFATVPWASRSVPSVPVTGPSPPKCMQMRTTDEHGAEPQPKGFNRRDRKERREVTAKYAKDSKGTADRGMEYRQNPRENERFFPIVARMGVEISRCRSEERRDLKVKIGAEIAAFQRLILWSGSINLFLPGLHQNWEGNYEQWSGKQ